MITEEQIQDVVQRIVEGYAPDRIILFGSYAYGVPTEDSDLDLLIIKRDAEEKRMARAIAVRTLLWGTDAPAMDILIRTRRRDGAGSRCFSIRRNHCRETRPATVCCLRPPNRSALPCQC
ncbi:nucleotidyltransferase domain-containing protein [Hymenobacter glacialis]|uniref:nucleotidyltransferase domain-containing protein n=1 Tax=Hymenobacter glacialis TaxID=1908236 RepID=UPI0009F1784E